MQDEEDDGRAAEGPAILGRMFAAYRSCGTYADDGVVEEVVRIRGHLTPISGTFDTTFVAPNRLRFHSKELLDPQGKAAHFVLWTSPRAVYVWESGMKAKRRVPRLADGLSAALPPSHGVARLILPLLVVASVKLRSGLMELKEAELEGEELLGGTYRCWRIGARHPRSGAWRLWIDQERLALRQLLLVGADRLITFRPRLAGPIGEIELAFDPKHHRFDG